MLTRNRINCKLANISTAPKRTSNTSNRIVAVVGHSREKSQPEKITRKEKKSQEIIYKIDMFHHVPWILMPFELLSNALYAHFSYDERYLFSFRNYLFFSPSILFISLDCQFVFLLRLQFNLQKGKKNNFVQHKVSFHVKIFFFSKLANSQLHSTLQQRSEAPPIK